ncbi:MAG: bifunctional diguanylate cyclase/phosphodiesterase [Bacillota bacterium]|nr:bifunctional diguanylate cyclase/phosphodiesterase [Bacillota bacterium]
MKTHRPQPVDKKTPETADHHHPETLNPNLVSAKIILIYAIIGFVWIVLTDWAAEFFFGGTPSFERAQTIKGWFYVGVTAIIFYLIIRRSMGLYASTIERLGRLNATLDSYAYIDSLTGLPNRNSAERFVTEELQGDAAVFLLFDIDDFHNINDIKGHAVGDELLRAVAEILKVANPSPHFVARIGGDEFIVIMRGPIETLELERAFEGMLRQIRKPWSLGGSEFYVTYSAGYAICPRDGGDFLTLLRCADTALSAAKDLGKNRFVKYDETLANDRLAAILLGGDLRRAVTGGDFKLHYQPIVNLKTGRAEGVEALIRWVHPTRGNVPPLAFIPLAEKIGVILEIDLFVIERVFLQANIWNGAAARPLKMSVNLSAKSLIDPRFIPELRRLVAATKVDAASIRVEITETAFVENYEEAIHNLLEIKAMGFILTLDDFGIGYSSLTYLSRLPMDVLKIDREFVRKASEGVAEGAILKFIIEMAHLMGMKVIAEGIETEKQLQVLKAYGGDCVQGFLFSRPLPEPEAYAWIQKHQDGTEG